MRRILVALSLLLLACEPSCMGLPTTREETATPATPVKSNTINAIQDCIVGSKHGERWQWYSLVDAFKDSGSDPTARTNGYLTGGGAAVLLKSLPVFEGQRIKGYAFKIKNANGAGTMKAAFECYDAFTNVDDTELSFADNVAAAERTITGAPAAPFTIASGYVLHVQLEFSAAAQRIYAVGVLVDCP